jgi:hypothetical protein
MVAEIVKTKLLEFIRPHNRSFLSVVLAFSLFGFLWPHHMNSAKARQPHYKANTQMPAENWDHEPDGVYSPPRSPGWHDLTSS